MKIGIKAKRNIGLIAVTLIVIIAVILVIYFVQKADNDSAVKNGAIGQTISVSKGDISVKDMKIYSSIGDMSADDGKCFLLLSVTFVAKNNMKVQPNKFEVVDGKQVFPTAEGFEFLQSSVSVKKGEELKFNLAYEVEANRVKSFYFCAYNAKIDLGGSIGNVWDK